MSKENTRSQRKSKLSPLLKIVKAIFALALLGLVLAFCLSRSQTVDGNKSNSDLASQLEITQKYNFIREIAPLAQNEEKKYGIRSSIILAQACLESDFGRSLLSAKYHNLFGIKAYGNEAQVEMNTQEYENGQWITIKGAFRTYPNWKTSVEDHSMLFVNGVTWDHAKYQSVMNAKDYKSAAIALEKSGYATDPSYSESLIQVIQEYKLNQYD